jgi:nicotinamidase-related amidase
MSGGRTSVAIVAKTVFLMIDVQRNMLLPPNQVPAAKVIRPRLDELLSDARIAGIQVIHVRNNGSEGDPDRPGSDGWQLVHQVRDDEAIIDKTEPNSFAGTNLADFVDPEDRLIIAGMQSEYCVRATALEAISRGHRVTVVSGAHATYDDVKPADEISADVDAELAAAGVRVTVDPWSWES